MNCEHKIVGHTVDLTADHYHPGLKQWKTRLILTHQAHQRKESKIGKKVTGRSLDVPISGKRKRMRPREACIPDIRLRRRLVKEFLKFNWNSKNVCALLAGIPVGEVCDAAPGTRHFYELVEAHRYTKEWHIPAAADFSGARGLKVLEIGCGLGTDGARFAEAGAHYTGVDLTEAAVELARRRFELFDLPGTFQTADAESLSFPDESFDLVYSHGVLHHTPETGKALQEIHRVLRPRGRAVVMLYHRGSYNYRVNISLLRRAGAQLLKWETGIKLVNRITGEPMESVREHARLLKTERESYLKPRSSYQTRRAGNPLARFIQKEARELFKRRVGRDA